MVVFRFSAIHTCVPMVTVRYLIKNQFILESTQMDGISTVDLQWFMRLLSGFYIAANRIYFSFLIIKSVGGLSSNSEPVKNASNTEPSLSTTIYLVIGPPGHGTTGNLY